MIQEYLYGFYQPGTVMTDINIRIVQYILDITNSYFESSEILTLDLTLLSCGTPMNLTIIYRFIYRIPYISQTYIGINPSPLPRI